MSDFFQELNLPLPIDNKAKERILDIKRSETLRPYLFLTRNPEMFLNSEILNVFSKINILPDTMIAFGHVDNKEFSLNNPMIHSDIIFSDNHWKKVPFAINWELDHISPMFKWWDTSELPEVYPSDFSSNDVFRYGQGIHYGARRNRDTSKMKCLEQYQVKDSRALMIRTEVPHSAYYNPGTVSRTSISLRFPLDKIPSWESALLAFKSFLW